MRKLVSISVLAIAIMSSPAAASTESCFNIIDPIAVIDCLVKDHDPVVTPMGPGSGGTGGGTGTGTGSGSGTGSGTQQEAKNG